MNNTQLANYFKKANDMLKTEASMTRFTLIELLITMITSNMTAYEAQEFIKIIYGD